MGPAPAAGLGVGHWIKSTCPSGAITELRRADLGPETARYLTAQFQGGGGQATVVVRVV